MFFLFDLINRTRARPRPRTRPSHLAGSVDRRARQRHHVLTARAPPLLRPTARPPPHRPCTAAASPDPEPALRLRPPPARPRAAVLRPYPISASDAPPLAARLPEHHRTQVNSTDPLPPAADDASAAPSSATPPHLPRARRRSPVDGSRRRCHRRVPRLET